MQFSQEQNSNEGFPPTREVTFQLRLIFWLAVIAVGLLQFWAHRNDMNPDGISYIEMAQASMQTGWHALINGYWSPLYPFLISLALRIFHPSPEWEFTVVHGLNFVLYLASFACFELFLREIVRASQFEVVTRSDSRPVSPRTFWMWACGLFLWSSQYWLTATHVVPDICVAALVYLATAILFRIWGGTSDGSTFVIFGAILGTAYLAKAVMFPLGFVLLACAFLLLVKRSVPFRRIAALKLATLAAFAALSVPLIFSISHAKGRLTFGDSGKISYAEYVNKVTLGVHWQGEPGGVGTPLHSTRKISSDPPIYEFAEPVPGSYPPWYDPSYWYDGVKPHFSVRGQLWVLFRAANAYLKMFSKSGALYFVVLALFWLSKRVGSWAPIPNGVWFVLLPCVTALFLYSLVLVEFRYVAPFALVLLVWLFSRLQLREPPTPHRHQRLASSLILFAPLLAIIWPVSSDIAAIFRPKPFELWNVAQGLHELGVPPDARIGFIGRGNQAYWAHLAGVRIIAELPEQAEPAFFDRDAEKQAKALEKFAETRAAIVVMKVPPKVFPALGWQQIAGTPYYLHPLNGTKLRLD